jgi:hypothetical protein
MLATTALLTFQVPPATLFDNELEAPIQTDNEPEIVDGDALTVTIVVRAHPAFVVNVIVALPAVTPVTTPVADPTVAVAISLLLHVPPPAVLLLSVVTPPSHTVAIPVVMAIGFTVIKVVALQPVGKA